MQKTLVRVSNSLRTHSVCRLCGGRNPKCKHGLQKRQPKTSVRLFAAFLVCFTYIAMRHAVLGVCNLRACTPGGRPSFAQKASAFHRGSSSFVQLCAMSFLFAERPASTRAAIFLARHVARIAIAALLAFSFAPTRSSFGEDELGFRSTSEDIARWRSQVEILRDEWGVAHIIGATDEATLFGAGYAQAEDNFWQLEDNVMRGCGRYAELYGAAVLENDLLNRTFQIPQRSREDYVQLPLAQQRIVSAFVAGINDFIAHHPDVSPRRLRSVEPWHILSMDRHFLVNFAYGRTRVSKPAAMRELTPTAAESAPRQRCRAKLGRLGRMPTPISTRTTGTRCHRLEPMGYCPGAIGQWQCDAHDQSPPALVRLGSVLRVPHS